MAIEADLEREVIKWAKSQGGRALKLKIDNERGFPDRTIILPGGVVGFVELKRANGSIKKYAQQILQIEWLKCMGYRAAFCETLDEVKELFE